jgi:hypothetical protein
LFAGSGLAFNESAALIWARLMAEGTAEGRPRSALRYALIAAVAEANNCILVTGNERHFRAVPRSIQPGQSRREQMVVVDRTAAAINANFPKHCARAPATEQSKPRSQEGFRAPSTNSWERE